MKVSLSDREISVLNSALFTAREEFHKHANTAKADGHTRVYEQFLSQAAACSDMMEKLETVVDHAVLAS